MRWPTRVAAFDYVLLVVALASCVAAGFLALVHLTAGPPAQRVHIRWAPTVSDSERARVEREHGLVNGEPLEGRTWQYFLSRRSAGDVERIIRDPRVEDTFHIDRAAFRVQLDRAGLSPNVRRWLESDRLGQIGLAVALAAALMMWGLRRTLAALNPSGVLFFVSTAIFGSAFGGFLWTTNYGDMETHLAFAQRLELNQLPHFLFEILLRMFVATGLPYKPATALLLGLCYGGMAVLIAREMKRRGVLTPWRAFAIIPATLIASHIFLFTLASYDLYRGYLSAVVYHSPTQQLNKLFALWITLLYGATFLEGETVRVRTCLAFAILCVLSAVAKPSFLIAFLPAVALWTVADLYALRRPQLLRLGSAIFLPAVIVLFWQVRNTYASETASSVIVAPFAVFKLDDVPLRFSMSLAFPLVVATAALWTRTWNARLGFVWTFVAIAVAITLVLTETGRRAPDGNFGWTGQTAAFLVYVESALFLLSTKLDRVWTRVAWGVFGVHVACGLFWYGLVFTLRWYDYTRL